MSGDQRRLTDDSWLETPTNVKRLCMTHAELEKQHLTNFAHPRRACISVDSSDSSRQLNSQMSKDQRLGNKLLYYL